MSQNTIPSPDTQRRIGAIALNGETHLSVRNDINDAYELSSDSLHKASDEQERGAGDLTGQSYHDTDNALEDNNTTFWFPEEGGRPQTHQQQQQQQRWERPSWCAEVQEWVYGWTDRRRLWQFAMNYRWFIAMNVLFCVTGIVMYIHRVQFLEALEKLSNTVRGMGVGGYILMSFLIFLSAFPPMIGYSLFQTLSGFTFGFAKGFPISYLSALLGSIVCFTISRIWLKGSVIRLMARYPNLEAVVHAVEKKGFKLFLLIRLSPYPFNLLNVLFAATNISLFNFALGTAITLTKIALHIYIGANLTSFAKHLMGDDDEDMSESDRRAESVRMIAAALGSILAFGVMIYIYFIAKRAVNEVEQGELDRDESAAFLTHQEVGDADAESLDAWMEWNDDDDDDHSVGHAHRATRDVERGGS